MGTDRSQQRADQASAKGQQSKGCTNRLGGGHGFDQR